MCMVHSDSCICYLDPVKYSEIASSISLEQVTLGDIGGGGGRVGGGRKLHNLKGERQP